MQFQEILTQFRALGGVADNLTFRHGNTGRGLFAINPAQSVRLHVPEHLLVSPQWVELDETGNLRIASKFHSLLNAKAIDFFEQYQKYFGWGVGGFDSVKQHQIELQGLPPKLKNFLHILGGADELMKKPTPKYCMRKYFINRQISFKSESRLMPIAELINHAPDGLPYVLEDGVKVDGMVMDEILAKYHSNLDSFHFFFNYHFATPANSALSCDVTVDVPGMGTLKIARMDHMANYIGPIRTPEISTDGNAIILSFAEIANKSNPSLPRRTFTNLMANQHVSTAVSNEIFDGLIEHNRQVLRELILTCQRYPSSISSCIENVASFQLTVID